MLKFSDQPTISPPLSKFDGFVKRFNVSALSSDERIVLENAFPAFVALKEPTPEMIEHMEQQRRRGVDYIMWQNRPQRRYSGGDDLPRGRYYSLAYSHEGNDGGTLLRELLAYSYPVVGGFMLLVDIPKNAPLTVTEIGLKIIPEYWGNLLILFIDSPKGRSPFVETMIRERAIRNINRDPDGRTIFAVKLPYEVIQINIDKVFDLRSIEAQEWLVTEFAQKDTEFFKKLGREGADSFYKLLPSLLCADHGGDHFTNAIGVWMRMNDINALIYPSARSNCELIYENRKRIFDYGWCMVDYRNAPKPTLKHFIDISHGWPQKLGKNSNIHIANDQFNLGSWRIRGIEEWHQENLNLLEKEFMRSMNS